MNGNQSTDIKTLIRDEEESFVNHLLSWKDKFGLFAKKKQNIENQ